MGVMRMLAGLVIALDARCSPWDTRNWSTGVGVGHPFHQIFAREKPDYQG